MEQRVYITKNNFEEANPFFRRDIERAWQDYLKRKAHADMIMLKNKLNRQSVKSY